MFTLGELIEYTRHQLSGLDSDKDAVSSLRLSLPVGVTTVAVDDVAGASVGIVEVDLEQMRVRSVNAQDAALTLWPFGRGYRGTTVAEHSTGAEVRFNPSWPASTIAREINGVLTELYPALYAVRAHETVVPSQGAIDIPAAAVGVISVWVEDRNNADQWVRDDRWDFNPDSSTVGRGLRVSTSLTVGTGLRIIYAARPTTFNLNGSLTQDFADATGLDARVADLITLGVARRVAPFIDVAKLPGLAAAAADAGANKAPGNGATTARLLHQLFQARLADEAAVLTKEHPIRVHRTR